MKFTIRNFKCFQKIVFSIDQLSVFTGLNGNGKSTAIQSMLIYRKSIERCATYKNTRYELGSFNGLGVDLSDCFGLMLGNTSSIIPINSNDKRVLLGVIDLPMHHAILYKTESEKPFELTPMLSRKNKPLDNPFFFKEFYYLNAERIGPRLSQSISGADFHNVGYKGEYTAYIIASLNYNFKVEKERVNFDFLKGNRFEHHINAWLNFIFGDTSIRAYIDDKSYSARVEFESDSFDSLSVSPTNTGFGFSYSLPIIVTGLIAKRGRIFIVENPEAHLHPSAQSRMGYFLAVIANAGVKVVIETHSDHVINGIQLAVAKEKIVNSDITINFFNRSYKSKQESFENHNQPSIEEIKITTSGELTNWPSGFFDQTLLDYSQLLNLRKNV